MCKITCYVVLLLVISCYNPYLVLEPPADFVLGAPLEVAQTIRITLKRCLHRVLPDIADSSETSKTGTFSTIDSGFPRSSCIHGNSSPDW